MAMLNTVHTRYRSWHVFFSDPRLLYLQSCRVRTGVPGEKFDSRQTPDLIIIIQDGCRGVKLGELCSIDACKLPAHVATLQLR